MRNTVILLWVVLCLSSWVMPAEAGTCPYKKKKSAHVQAAGAPQYQTADSVKKEYRLNGQGVSSQKVVEVQTAEDVLKKIERDQKKQEKASATTDTQAVSYSGKKTSLKSHPPSMKPFPSAKRKPLRASPAVEQAMQGLAGQKRGYTIDMSAASPEQPASSQ
jgi:hypothetical protein